MLTIGDSLEQAYLRMELVEHLARIYRESLAFGGPHSIDSTLVPKLLAARKRAGLGPKTSGQVFGHSSESPSMPSARPDEDLTELITREVTRILQGQKT